jgi:hypothetical protein
MGSKQLIIMKVTRLDLMNALHKGREGNSSPCLALANKLQDLSNIQKLFADLFREVFLIVPRLVILSL